MVVCDCDHSVKMFLIMNCFVRPSLGELNKILIICLALGVLTYLLSTFLKVMWEVLILPYFKIMRPVNYLPTIEFEFSNLRQRLKLSWVKHFSLIQMFITILFAFGIFYLKVYIHSIILQAILISVLESILSLFFSL